MKIEITPNTNPIDLSAALTPVDKTFGSSGGSAGEAVILRPSGLILSNCADSGGEVSVGLGPDTVEFCVTPLNLVGGRDLLAIGTLDNFRPSVALPGEGYTLSMDVTIELVSSAGVIHTFKLPATQGVVNLQKIQTATIAGATDFKIRFINTLSKWVRGGFPDVATGFKFNGLLSVMEFASV